MKIAFLLPVSSDARCQKRVKALERLGVESEILAFERDYYPGKPWPDGYISLGRMEHRHYHKRFAPLMKALPTVREAVKRSDVIYAFGLDMLLLGWLARSADRKPVKIVYEVADIFDILIGDGVTSYALRWMERSLLQNVDLLVVTSKAFVEEYYQGMQGMVGLPYIVVENKLDARAVAQLQEPRARCSEEGVLRIGYFGLIRCPPSWRALKRCVSQGNGHVRVYVRGIPVGLNNFEEDVESSPYIRYGGPYIAPDESPEMYQQVDIVWIATHISKAHLLWARTNRFYEACFFKRPMFAQTGTQDGRVVEAMGLGVCVDLTQPEETANRILAIDEGHIVRWQENVARLPARVYTYTGEHEELLRLIA